VTEQVCLKGSEALGGKGRVTILRVGQLCGDTVSGRWNEKEGWPLMIRTTEEVGCLPILEEVGQTILC
jgi:thioester reductase-like protein